MKKILTAATAALLTTAALPASAALREVTGTLRFEDATGSQGNYTPQMNRPVRPIRHVTVKLKVNGNEVDTVTTNSDGVWSTWIDESQLPVGQMLKIEFESKNYAGVVKLDLDYFDDSLLFTSETEIPDPQWWFVFDATVTVEDFSQHMSILDAVLYGREYANARREDSDSIGYVSVEYPDAAWTHYEDFWGDIVLSGPPAYGYGDAGAVDNGFTDGVVLHEYGHHLEYDISDIDDAGGDHTACTDNGFGFAWAESWGYFYASTVKDTYPNTMMSGFDDIEPIPSCTSPSSEMMTETVLWDLYDDGSNESFDRMNGSYVGNNGKSVRDTMFGVFDVEQDDYVGPYNTDPQTSILTFHEHLVARNLHYGAHADMDRIYWAHTISPHPMVELSVPDLWALPTAVIAGQSTNLTMTLRNDSSFFYTDEDVLVTVSVWPSGQNEQDVDAFLIPGWSGDQVVARSVTIPSNVPQGQQFVFVRLDVIDRFQEKNEKNNVLAIPIEVVSCGNGVCGAGESCSTCPKDCGSCTPPKCGNGVCSLSESCLSCPKDCGSCTPNCGDGICQGKETKKTCPADCAAPGP